MGPKGCPRGPFPLVFGPFFPTKKSEYGSRPVTVTTMMTNSYTSRGREVRGAQIKTSTPEVPVKPEGRVVSRLRIRERLGTPGSRVPDPDL